jgi:hypothetical protein
VGIVSTSATMLLSNPHTPANFYDSFLLFPAGLIFQEQKIGTVLCKNRLAV